MKKRRKAQVYSRFVNGKRVHKETGIEKKMRYLLRALKIDFKQEFEIEIGKIKKIYDFFCYSEEEGWKFIIECHGSYFHAQDYHEGTVTSKALSRKQKKNIKNDELKISILQKKKLPLLVFWERDIDTKLLAISKKIKEEINRQKQLIRNNHDTFSPLLLSKEVHQPVSQSENPQKQSGQKLIELLNNLQ